MINPKPCFRMAAASACGNPCSLFISISQGSPPPAPPAPPLLRSHRRFVVDAALAHAFPLRTPADGNVKTPYPRPAHDLFLILRLDPLYGQGTGARRTLRRNRHRNLLI